MSGGIDMNSVIMITQFFFTLVIGMYFFTKLRNEKSDSETLANNSKKEAEQAEAKPVDKAESKVAVRPAESSVSKKGAAEESPAAKKTISIITIAL